MAQQLTNSFTTYQLTEEEQTQSRVLTSVNIMAMQNLMAGAAEEKLGLKFDPLNPMQFAQREAELMGQIGILKFLIELATSANSTTL